MDIRARVNARRDLDALRAARDLDGLAAALNAEGLMTTRSVSITSRGIRAAMGVVDAVNFLSLLRSVSTATELPAGILAVLRQMGVPESEDFAYLDTFASAHHWLGQEAGLDMGPQRTRDMMSVIAASDPAKYGRAVSILLDMVKVPLIVNRMQVNEAMFNDDGSEKTE